MSLSSWMTSASKAFLNQFVLTSKSNPLVDKVEIILDSPNYSKVCCLNGRKVTVLLQNSATRPQEDSADEKPYCPLSPVNNQKVCSHNCGLLSEQDEVTRQSVENCESPASLNLVPRRSSRFNKDIPPLCYGACK